MFKIGDFSRIARVSARLLRFYDELGLLKPEQADPHTGYRYYAISQIARLNRILVLKDLGFQLDEIGKILDEQPSAAELRAMLLVRRQDAQRALHSEAQRLRQIDLRIRQIENEGTLAAEDVMIRSEPARLILSVRRTLPSFLAARTVAAEVRAAARASMPRHPLGALIAISHSMEFESDELDLEIGFIIDEGARPDLAEAAGPTLRTLEAVERMAVCIRIGLPEDAHLVTTKIGNYLAANGDRFAGPGREYFLQLPPPDRMHEAVVEMQFPVVSTSVR